jgi:hypothetical protein
MAGTMTKKVIARAVMLGSEFFVVAALHALQHGDKR